MRPELDPRDGPRDECGVFGVYAPEHDVARLAYFALYALQHRGQESAGIATARGRAHHDRCATWAWSTRSSTSTSCARSPATMAIGHVRYSTTGSSAWENAQPVYRSDRREVALAHNGNLINAVELHAELREQGVEFRSTSDSEIIAALLSTHEADTHRGRAGRRDAAAGGRLLDGRDDQRRRGRLPRPGGPAAAGARAARRALLRGLGDLRVRHHRRRAAARGRARARWCRCGAAGCESRQVVEGRRKAFCVFEHIYFARPDSLLEGNRTQVSRRKMGEILWREAPVRGRRGDRRARLGQRRRRPATPRRRASRTTTG